MGAGQGFIDLGQRLVEGVPLGREHLRADHLFEVLDLGSHRSAAGNLVIDRVQLVIDHLRFAVRRQTHTQFTQVLNLGAGLHHRRAPIDQHRLRQSRVRVTANDDIDARHLLDQLDLFTAPAAVFLLHHTHVRKQNHHLGTLLAQLGDHGLGSRDRIGKHRRFDHRADCHGVVTEQAEQAKTNAALVDQLVRRNAPGVVMDLQAVVFLARRVKAEVARQQRHQRIALDLVRRADHRGQPGRTKIEFVVAQGRCVIAQLGHQAQLTTGFAGHGVKQRAHAEVAPIKQQHRLLASSSAALLQQGGQARNAADGIVIAGGRGGIFVVRAKTEQA